MQEWDEAHAGPLRPAAAQHPQAPDPAAAGYLDRLRSAGALSVDDPAMPAAARYTPGAVLAEGAMAEIRGARDRHLQREVALKLLKSRWRTEADIARFIREAQVTAQLDHPNIVPVYSLQVDAANRVSFAMKKIAGRTLTAWLDDLRGRAEPPAAWPSDDGLATRLEVMIKVCEALYYAHSRGVIHRDLKPGNIMVGRFHEVYVMDWGVARCLEHAAPDDPPAAGGGDPLDLADTERTLAGQAVGTPRYMSPEQARGLNDQLDARSDIYALGSLLFEMVSLRHAFPGADARVLLGHVAQGRHAPLLPQAPGVPLSAELAAIICKAMALDPDDRYPSARDLGEDLRRFLRREETRARPDNPPQRLLRWLSHHRQWAAVAILGLLALAGGVASWSLLAQKQALVAARVREQRLTGFQAAVAARASDLDRHFQYYQDVARNFAALALQALKHGQPAGEPLYDAGRFAQPGGAPPDAVAAPAYREPISLDHPVYKLAPGVDLEHARPDLERLALLRYWLRQVLRDNALGTGRPAPATAARQQVLTAGTPIRWLYLGLASGVYFCYPGSGNYPALFDPRERPWYLLAAAQTQMVWSAPYVDIGGHYAVISCAVPIWDDPRWYGVATLDVTLNTLLQRFLHPDRGRGVTDCWLLTATGRVLAGSGVVQRPDDLPRHLARAGGLPWLPYDAVVDAIRQGHTAGQAVFRDDAQDAVLAFNQLPSLGWYYVEKAGLDDLPLR